MIDMLFLNKTLAWAWKLHMSDWSQTQLTVSSLQENPFHP